MLGLVFNKMYHGYNMKLIKRNFFFSDNINAAVDSTSKEMEVEQNGKTAYF